MIDYVGFRFRQRQKFRKNAQNTPDDIGTGRGGNKLTETIFNDFSGDKG
jgi:hypothetical protein